MDEEWLNNPKKLDSTDATVLGSGCAAGAATGALVGTIVPGVGNVFGGVIGCLSGGIIAGTTEIIFKKTDYLSGIYIGNSKEVMEACGQ